MQTVGRQAGQSGTQRTLGPAGQNHGSSWASGSRGRLRVSKGPPWAATAEGRGQSLPTAWEGRNRLSVCLSVTSPQVRFSVLLSSPPFSTLRLPLFFHFLYIFCFFSCPFLFSLSSPLLPWAFRSSISRKCLSWVHWEPLGPVFWAAWTAPVGLCPKADLVLISLLAPCTPPEDSSEA